MIKSFPKKPSQWVEEKLSNLTIEQKIGQLLHPFIIPRGEGDFVSGELIARGGILDGS